MKTRLLMAVICLLSLRAEAFGQPPGCTWEGDPALRYGWFEYNKMLPYHQPGPDTLRVYAGQTWTDRLGPYNASTSWLPAGCKATDTLCFRVSDSKGWGIACAPAEGTPFILDAGYFWHQDVSITVPCSAAPGEIDMIVARCCYVNNAGICDPACGDCHDPSVRPLTGISYYSADTLYAIVDLAPPNFSILQDSVSYVTPSQQMAYVPFSICNEDECAPPTEFGYRIKSVGRIGSAIDTAASVTVDGGECEDVFGVINASVALTCTYDTLTIVAWRVAPPLQYDTCVQIVHAVSMCCVPVLTAPVVVLLVLALAAAAAAMLLRRSPAAGGGAIGGAATKRARSGLESPGDSR